MFDNDLSSSVLTKAVFMPKIASVDSMGHRLNQFAVGKITLAILVTVLSVNLTELDH
jgi:hypothetical protein